MLTVSSLFVRCALCSLVGAAVSAPAFGWAEKPEIDGTTLLARMRARHDPAGSWMAGRFALTVVSTYADGRQRRRECEIDYASHTYRQRVEIDGHAVRMEVTGDRCRLWIDGAELPSSPTAATAALAKKLNVSCDRARLFRNYMSYLWGLPMKLGDPGTIVAPTVTRDEFQGAPVLTLHVRYAKGVGTDRWRFYARPDTYAMVGYAFDKADGKGEYIVLDGEVGVEGGARIPKTRRWYMTADDRFLGTDVLEAAKRLP